MLYIAVILCIAGLVALYFLNQRSGTPSLREDTVLPYKKKDYLLTKSERAFFDVLLPTIKNEYHVFTKVNMLDLFFLPKGTQNRLKWRGHVSQKHVDFVLCDLKNLKPIVCIELDDASHEEEDRQERDALVDRIFSSAGLPLLHVRATTAYNPTFIKTQINNILIPTKGTA